MHSNRAPWAATQACSRLGTPNTAQASLRNNWLDLLQSCLELLDDAYLLPSVDLQLQLIPYEEVQRVDFLLVEARTLQSLGIQLEGRAVLPQKRFDTE